MSVECCMDAFLWETNKCPGYFSAVGTQFFFLCFCFVLFCFVFFFFEITVAKPSLQMIFLMWFVSPIANQDILNQNWKCVSNYGQNVTFSKHKNRFTCIITTVSNDACMSLIHMITHCLVYVLLEDLNQISRTEKCHFAFYIFHEQGFLSFTSI